jgi:hypothetical protein
MLVSIFTKVRVSYKYDCNAGLQIRLRAESPTTISVTWKEQFHFVWGIHELHTDHAYEMVKQYCLNILFYHAFISFGVSTGVDPIYLQHSNRIHVPHLLTWCFIVLWISQQVSAVVLVNKEGLWAEFAAHASVFTPVWTSELAGNLETVYECYATGN